MIFSSVVRYTCFSKKDSITHVGVYKHLGTSVNWLTFEYYVVIPLKLR